MKYFELIIEKNDSNNDIMNLQIFRRVLGQTKSKQISWVIFLDEVNNQW